MFTETEGLNELISYFEEATTLTQTVQCNFRHHVAAPGDIAEVRRPGDTPIRVSLSERLWGSCFIGYEDTSRPPSFLMEMYLKPLVEDFARNLDNFIVTETYKAIVNQDHSPYMPRLTRDNVRVNLRQASRILDNHGAPSSQRSLIYSPRTEIEVMIAGGCGTNGFLECMSFADTFDTGMSLAWQRTAVVVAMRPPRQSNNKYMSMYIEQEPNGYRVIVDALIGLVLDNSMWAIVFDEGEQC